MQKNLFQGSLTIRRVAFATIWAAIGSLLTAGLVGVALAGDEATSQVFGPIPATLSVPPPALGDEANYTITFVDMDATTIRVRDAARPFLDFSWDVDRPMRDASGNAVRGHAWKHRFHQPDETNETAGGYAHLVYDAATGRAFAQIGGSAMAVGAAGSSPTITPTTEESASETFLLFYNDDDWTTYDLPCGVRNVLQGKTVELTQGLAVAGDCWRFENWDPSPCERFDPIGSERIGEWDTVVLESAPNDCTFSSEHRLVWLSSAVPYPVRLMASMEGSDRYSVLDLVGYKAGSAPLDTSPVTGRPLAPVELAPTKPWGPDDADLVHPFKLSEAFALARDHKDSPIREFMAQHAAAFVTWARSSESIEDGRSEWSWWFYLADGSATAGVSVRKTVESAEASAIPIHQEATSKTTFTFAEAKGGPAPLSDAYPAVLPTVKSLMERWKGFAGNDFASLTANSWTIRPDCAETCDLLVGAGIDHDETHYGSPVRLIDPSASRQWDLSVLLVDASGRAQEISEGRSSWARVPVSQTPATQNEGLTSSSLALAPIRDGWHLPPAAVAGAGGVGLLLGLAYWLWPSIKAGAFGLFSRVERPTALDQSNRAAINALVEANPGIHFQEIGRRLSLGHGTVEHHLRKLVQVGILSQQTTGGYHCYFPKGTVDRRLMVAAPILKADGARAVLTAVASNRRSGREIAAATGLDPGTVSYHVKKLAAASLVALERQGREVRVGATDLGRTALSTAA